MPKVTVDGQEIEVPEGATVLQACELAGKEIPRFCYHERLSIAGNCRMCLVEVKPGPPKPQASCALPATDGQEIRTDTPMVKTAREGVMEFLLINHPLDCPICDQGGECDLQDQSIAYGRGATRYTMNKRAVTEKYMGPLIKTIMTRCIHCTRCVRFSEEIAGVDEIGALGRGEDMEITTYLEQAAEHELSANVIDLCPVGALTSRPYAFEARPWELKKTLSIDVSDAVGANIRLDSRGREVMRALPRINDDVNEEWISDKARYQIDGLSRRRLDKVFMRQKSGKGRGKLQEASWDEAFKAIAKAKPGKDIAAIAGDMVDCETMFAAKALLKACGSTLLEGRQTGMDYDVSNLAAVNFNSTFAGIETADAILIVGSHIRWEAPLVNVRLRKAVKRGAKVFVVGPFWDTTYPAVFLGDELSVLGDLPDEVAEVFNSAERPAIIMGGAALAQGALGAGLRFADQFQLVRDGWNGFNVLHFSAARMGGLMLGYAQKGGMKDIVEAKPKVVISLGADEMDFEPFADTLKVYIGHHGDKGAHAADIILPGASYAEKDGTYVNTEGRVQFAEKAVFAPGDAREDWTILRALADALKVEVGFDSFAQLQSAMIAEVPSLGEEGLADLGGLPKADEKATAEGTISAYPIKDFYLTNPIARASEVMHRCSAELLHGGELAEAAE
ncbi:NADH-quinone oxidoreductase subunit NuoG [Qipengyuania huizhouensis]|uniref:NADH-quinone oxidoreductase subunit NuoG n=1 Tax=Qipengyuania huizhouensis TaxID=2867245 RepID=UPI0017A4210B|nr:NADH-quinone oxidoreductase subunit NuoG [Qipengyuania huizhouensis]MBA4764216.1 NADH-quinone oxidoreductase subunit G [Erythrobacter sp.]MBX7461037.1 NADH-quinone oxidoreductase subunit NuoG [Qipengyuania huizhouensis]